MSMDNWTTFISKYHEITDQAQNLSIKADVKQENNFQTQMKTKKTASMKQM